MARKTKLYVNHLKYLYNFEQSLIVKILELFAEEITKLFQEEHSNIMHTVCRLLSTVHV
jgi:hypothetical protein